MWRLGSPVTDGNEGKGSSFVQQLTVKPQSGSGSAQTHVGREINMVAQWCQGDKGSLGCMSQRL